MSILDSLNILLKADTKGLQAGLKAGASSIKSFAGSAIGGFAGVATAIGTYVAAIGSSAVVSTLKDMTMAAIDNAGKLDDLAQNLGISVQALQSLTYAAKLSGVELSGLEGLLKKLAVNLAEAGTGKGKQFEALQQLGLDAQTLINMPLDEAMKKIASELAKIENTSLRAGLGMDLFGKAMIDANAFIGRGTAGIEELEKHYASLGAQLTDEQVSKLTAAGDALDDLGIIAEGVGSQVGSILAPIITDITNQFVTMGVKSGALKETIKTVAEVAVMLAARVMDVAQGIVWYVNAHRIFIQGYAHIFIETAYQVVNALDMISGSTMAASSGLKDLRNANLKNIKDLAVSTTTGWDKATWGQQLEAYTKHAQAKGDVDAKAATQKRQIDEFLRKKAMEDAAYNEANAAHEKKWQDEQAAAIKAKVDAAEKLSNATKDLTASLEMQARTWGMNSTQAKIYELQMKGVTAAELQKAKQAAAWINNAEKQAKMDEEAKRLIEDMRTPLQKYGEEVKKIQELQKTGRLTPQQALKAREAAWDKQWGGEDKPTVKAEARFADMALKGSDEARLSILKNRELTANPMIVEAKKAEKQREEQIKQMKRTADAVNKFYKTAEW